MPALSLGYLNRTETLARPGVTACDPGVAHRPISNYTPPTLLASIRPSSFPALPMGAKAWAFPDVEAESFEPGFLSRGRALPLLHVIGTERNDGRAGGEFFA